MREDPGNVLGGNRRRLDEARNERRAFRWARSVKRRRTDEHSDRVRLGIEWRHQWNGVIDTPSRSFGRLAEAKTLRQRALADRGRYLHPLFPLDGAVSDASHLSAPSHRRRHQARRRVHAGAPRRAVEAQAQVQALSAACRLTINVVGCFPGQRPSLAGAPRERTRRQRRSRIHERPVLTTRSSVCGIISPSRARSAARIMSRWNGRRKLRRLLLAYAKCAYGGWPRRRNRIEVLSWQKATERRSGKAVTGPSYFPMFDLIIGIGVASGTPQVSRCFPYSGVG